MSEAGNSNKIASINADVTCVACHYNLRGLSATGLCPECGVPIEKSLEELPNGPLIVSALRQFAIAYSFMLGGLCFFPLVLVFPLRIIASARLSREGKLMHMSNFGSHVRLLLWFTIAETVAAIVFVLGIMQSPSQARLVGMLTTGAYFVMVLLEYLNAWILGQFCYAVATRIKHHRLKQILKVLFGLCAMFTLVSMVLILLSRTNGVPGSIHDFMSSVVVVVVFDLLFAITLIDVTREVQKEFSGGLATGTTDLSSPS